MTHPGDERRRDHRERGGRGASSNRSNPNAEHHLCGHHALQDVGEENPPPERVDEHAGQPIDDFRGKRRERERVVEKHAAALGITHCWQAEERQPPCIRNVVMPGYEVGVVVVLRAHPLAAVSSDELRCQRLQPEEQSDEARPAECKKRGSPYGGQRRHR